MLPARLTTHSSADSPPQMGAPPAQLCENGTPIPPQHRTHSSTHLPGLTNQTIATATGPKRTLPSSRRPAPRLSPTGGPPMRPSPTGVRPYPHSTESTARSTSLCKTARDTPRLREIPRAPLSPTRDDWPSPVTCRPTVGRHSRVQVPYLPQTESSPAATAQQW